MSAPPTTRNRPETETGGGSFAPQNSRRLAPGAALVATLALVLVPILWKPWIHGNDGVRNYAYCRSLWINGDFDFSNEYAHYRARGEMAGTAKLGAPDRATGKPGNALGAGSAVLWSPFFLAGHLWAKISRVAADGYSRPYVWSVSLGSTLYAIAGLLLLLDLLARRFGTRAALPATLAVWLGSPLVFYMYLHPSMSHACSFFLAALLVWECARWQANPRALQFFVMGATGGLAAITRFTDAVLLLLPAAVWVMAAARGRGAGAARRAAASGLILGAGVLVAILPQLAAWHSFYGSWFAGPRDYGISRNLDLWRSPHLRDVLFSGWRGLFVWSPALIVGAIGFGWLLPSRRALDWALALAAAVQLWFVGGWAVWWGGASFGQRLLIDLLPLFALGTACLFRRSSRPWARRTLAAFLALAVLWSAGLAVQYAGGIIGRESPVTFRQLARNQWRRVPVWVWGHARLLLPGPRMRSGGTGKPARS
jgi:hypothetical protein